jgi:F-type H+-transporting ATPase subunit b
MSEAHPVVGETPEHSASVEHGSGDHAQPSFHGVTAPMFIGLAMITVIAILIWKNVHKAIAKALDSKITTIRTQLEEAESLRKEAEALRAEYEAKSRSAESDAAALVERARHEAQEIVAKARTDAEALIERRKRMAEQKIAAEERAAVTELRATAAEAAAKAAARLIADRHDAAADQAVIDRTISEIAGR